VKLGLTTHPLPAMLALPSLDALQVSAQCNSTNSVEMPKKTAVRTNNVGSLAKYVPPPPVGHAAMMPLYRSLLGQNALPVNVQGRDLVVLTLPVTHSFALPPQAAGSDKETLISFHPQLSTRAVSVKLVGTTVQNVPLAGLSDCIDDTLLTSITGGLPLFGDHPNLVGPYNGHLRHGALTLTSPLSLIDGGTSYEMEPIAAPWGKHLKVVVYRFNPATAVSFQCKMYFWARSGSFPIGTSFGVSGYSSTGVLVWGGSSAPTTSVDQAISFTFPTTVMPTTCEYLSFELENSYVGASGEWGCELDKCLVILEPQTAVTVAIASDTLYLGMSPSELQDLKNIADNHKVALLGAGLWVVGDPTFDQRGRVLGGVGLRNEMDADHLDRSQIVSKIPSFEREQAHVNDGIICINVPRSRAAYCHPLEFGVPFPNWTSSYVAVTSGGTDDIHLVVQSQFTVGIVPTNAWMPKPARVPWMGEGADCLFHFLSDWKPVYENASHMKDIKAAFKRAVKRVPGYIDSTMSVLRTAAPIVGALTAVL